MWCLGTLKEGYEEDFIYYLATWDEKNKRLLGSDTSYLVTNGFTPFIIRGNGTPCLVNEQFITDLSSGKLILDNQSFFYYDLEASDFCKGRNGELAWLSSSNQVSVLSEGEKKPVLIPFEGMNLQAITFDSEGRLYVSAGFSYHYFCDDEPQLNENAGLYRLEMPEGKIQWKKIENTINPKIISLSPMEKGNILVGTSGSGLVQLKTEQLITPE